MTRLIFVQLFDAAAAILSAAEVPTAQPSDLTVHEWGTFTSVAGQDGPAVDWDALAARTIFPDS